MNFREKLCQKMDAKAAERKKDKSTKKPRKIGFNYAPTTRQSHGDVVVTPILVSDITCGAVHCSGGCGD